MAHHTSKFQKNIFCDEMLTNRTIKNDDEDIIKLSKC